VMAAGVITFVERYLEPEQTFIDRQMRSIAGCEVRFLARYRVPDHPYRDQDVDYLTPAAARQGTRARWRLRRLRQRLTRRYAWLSRSEALRLRELLRRWKPRILHAHWAPDAMLVEPTCRLLRLPLLVHFHGYDVSRLTGDPVYRSSLRRLFARMAYGITVSQQMRDRLIALGCPAERVRCHYTGVPEEYFLGDDVAPPHPGDFALLQVGRLADVKGHRHSLAAVARSASTVPRLRLRIVGDGPLRADLERTARALGIAERVEFAGRRSATAVIEELRRCHAVIVPSCTAADGGVEGLPNVAVEAMAAGRPVIATRSGGIPEAVCYAGNDWLVPEADAEALALRIQRLATDTGSWKRLRAEGTTIARSRFYLPTQNRELVRTYDAICEAGAGRRSSRSLVA
jgi:glycosyltransferase involved in cell wall biosynthesis